MNIFFKRAKPVFPESLSRVENAHVVFRGTLPCGSAKVFVTACSQYKLYVNGKFVSYGPARCAKDCYRVDELDVSDFLTESENEVTAFVSNPYVECFHAVKSQGFFFFEARRGEEVLLTGGEMACTELSCRERRTLRVNCQRTFIESYRANGGCLLPGVREDAPSLPLAVQPERRLFPRETLPPDNSVVNASACGEGRFAVGPPVPCFEDGIEEHLPARYFRFPIPEAENPSRLLQRVMKGNSGGSWQTFDFGRVTSGFLGMRVKVREGGMCALLFDELLQHGDLRHGRCVSENFIWFVLAPGEYEFESLEINTARYVKFMSFGGGARVSDVSVRQYRYGGKLRSFECGDPELNLLYEAACETFRQNAVDFFCDCPGRERGGWLCDSYFTGRAEYLLTGENRIERAFLQNFALYDGHQDLLPEEMLPSVYPSDCYDDKYPYIPNWAMFLVLELEEYAARTGDAETVAAFRKKLFALADWFQSYENESGLLENLPGWVFVEWSRANDLVSGINYPTNMLYARMLKALFALYGESRFLEKFETLKERILSESYDGNYFRDNAASKEQTEVCQYYAVEFLGLHEDERFSSLIRRLGERFSGTAHDEGVHPAAAFIGKYLRLQFLCREKRREQVLAECRALFLPMARRTGTLWENLNERGSCCHGFASYLACVLNELF